MVKVQKTVSLDPETADLLKKFGGSKWIREQIIRTRDKRVGKDAMVTCYVCGVMKRVDEPCANCRLTRKLQKEKEDKELKAALVEKAKKMLEREEVVVDPQRKSYYENLIKKHGGGKNATKRPIEERPRRVPRDKGSEEGTGKTEKGESGIESTDGDSF
jgi:hypothetical protein